jgi:phospholipid/cholesterol/gamma-HCH transport system substrate-binding protein
VGRVKKIALDPDRSDRVQVLADIDATAPIDGRTRASLTLQGVTGLLFVDLEQDHAAAKSALTQGRQYPMITSVPSDFDVLLSSLPELAKQAGELANKLNAALSEENVRAFSTALKNLRLASERLPPTMADVQALVADLRRTSAEVEAAAGGFRAIASEAAPDVHETLARMRQVAENLAQTSTRLDKFVADNQAGLTQFSNDGLPQFERLMREGRDAAREFRSLSRSLKQNPSQLIYEPRIGGVEVAR